MNVLNGKMSLIPFKYIFVSGTKFGKKENPLIITTNIIRLVHQGIVL